MRRFSPMWNHFREIDRTKARCLYCLRVLAISRTSISSLRRHLRAVHPNVIIEMPAQKFSPVLRNFEESDAKQVIKRKFGTGPLWDHYERIEAKKAKCLYCSRIIALSGSSIGNLNRHLKNKHPTINCIEKIDEGYKEHYDLAKPVALNGASLTNSKDFIILDKTTSPQIKSNVKLHLDEQLVKMIAKDYLPLRLVEEKGFKNFVQALDPRYTLPTLETLSKVLLPKVYNATFKKIKTLIRKASAICVTLDGWTSIVQGEYIAITAHFIDQVTDELCSVMIGCIQYDSTHTSSDLSEFLKNKFVEWEIENIIIAVVSDTTSNISKAVQLGDWHLINCFAHAINLVVAAGIAEISETIVRVRRIMEYCHKAQVQVDNTELHFKQDTTNSWNFTYEMLLSVEKMKDSITAVIRLLKSDLLLPEEDWEIIAKVVPILNFFSEIIKELSSEDTVSASKYIVYCKLINKTIDKHEEETFLPMYKVIKTLRHQMQVHFRDVETDVLLSEATILDPRFKKHGFSDIRNYERAATTLKLKIGGIMTPKTEANDGIAKPNSSNEHSIWEEFDGEDSVSVTQDAFIEFDKYIQDTLLKRQENPLQWWSERKVIYPHLYSYMIQRLNIRATSVPCARIYSKAGLALNERRTRLTTKKIPELALIGSN